MTQTLSAADEYRRLVKNKKAEIVDVTVPSGFVFKFEKPSKTRMLFALGTLPQAATSEAIAQWQDQGLFKKAIEAGDPNALKLVDLAFNSRDEVLRLSYSPKIVVGPAKSDKELSTDDIDDDDLVYLMKWVQSGGDPSLMLATFPEQSGQSAAARPNRKARRAAAK